MPTATVGKPPTADPSARNTVTSLSLEFSAPEAATQQIESKAGEEAAGVKGPLQVGDCLSK